MKNVVSWSKENNILTFGYRYVVFEKRSVTRTVLQARENVTCVTRDKNERRRCFLPAAAAPVASEYYFLATSSLIPPLLAACCY